MNKAESGRIFDWFATYVRSFERESGGLHPFLELKRKHSRRVAGYALSVAEGLGWTSAEVNVAHVTGLLHDIGRFLQFDEYGTFSDSLSVDHGECGRRIVEKEGVLSLLGSEEQCRILDGIRYHNAKTIPNDFPAASLPLLKLIRDVDQLDIFDVVLQKAAEDGFREFLEMFPDATLDNSFGPEVMREILMHGVCSIENVRSLGDFLVMLASWVYDLNYRPAFELFRQRKILERTLAWLPSSREVEELGAMLRSHLDKSLTR